jgi:hypothetical protein
MIDLLKRAAFVCGAVFVGVYLINYFILGNTADYLSSGERMGEWKKAKIREACFRALENPHRDPLMPKVSNSQHRISWRDLDRAVEMTAALNCYLVAHPDAVCERNNRAYIVDYINRYFAKFDEMLGVAKQYGQSEIETVEKLWDSPRNRAISAALASNISNGRLIKDDFGWTAPDALKSMLTQYRGTTDTCPKVEAASSVPAPADRKGRLETRFEPKL